VLMCLCVVELAKRLVQAGLSVRIERAADRRHGTNVTLDSAAPTRIIQGLVRAVSLCVTCDADGGA
jgi:hypothetical protein